MGIIGIIANPDSGKDIRRLVSHATVFDNKEKANIIERIILTIQQMGRHKIYIMPDRYNFGERIINNLLYDQDGIKKNTFEILNMQVTNSSQDTTEFARRMNQMRADVVIVLGGDGTSRAAAKGIGDIPIIPISTGTNNVFPEMGEGTIIGMAAAALASEFTDTDKCCSSSKVIEVSKGGKLIDIALIDTAISKHVFSGSKAIWDVNEITDIIVTKCHPASIGFSSLIGTSLIIDENDNYGAMAHVTKSKSNKMVPFAASIIEHVNISEIQKKFTNLPFTLKMKCNGMIALDGEREVNFKEGEEIAFCIKRNGPRKVNIKYTLASALENGFYNIRNKEYC